MAKLIDITGKALSGEWGTDDETGNGIPVLRTTNFTNEGVVNYDSVVTRTITKKNIDEKYLRLGDIILEKSGGSDKQPVGRVIYYDGPEKTYLFNNFTGLLRVKNPDQWLPRYVFYSLYANYKKGGTREYENKTTGLHNLKTDVYVSRYEVTDVIYDQQKLICERLDKIAGIIRLRKQEIQKLDDLIKARFVEMFGKGIMAGIPLKECCISVQGGGTPSMKHPEYYGGDVPFIKSGDVRGDTVSSGALWLTEKALIETTAKYVPKGAVLVVNRSAALLREFRAAIAGQPVVINQDIKAFIPKDEFTSEYLLWAIKIQTQFLLTKVTTVLTSHIDLKDLLELQIVPAPIEQQNEFSRFIAQVDKSKVAVQEALDKAQLLFDSLMQRYFG